MNEVTKVAQKFYDEAVQIRRKIHENPELGMKEFQTTQLILSELARYGVEIENVPLETGVCAIVRGKNPGKTLAIREDIDALPMEENTGLPFQSAIKGVCHSCGHDIHASVLLLCARILSEMRDELCGNVRFIFQPAEETMGGAAYLEKMGFMDMLPKADAFIGVHTSPDVPAGKIGIKRGAANASSDFFRVKVIGVGGHGAHPYRCVDPIVVSAYMITQLQTIISRENQAVFPAVLTIGSIHGGTASNIIPTEVEMQGTMRSFSNEERTKILAAIPRICNGCCETMRAKAEVEITGGVPPLINDYAVCDGIEAAAAKTLGAENVVTLTEASPGSEDFSLFLNHGVGAQFRVGTANEDPASKIGLHNPKTIFDEKAIFTGAAVMAQYALDFSK